MTEKTKRHFDLNGVVNQDRAKRGVARNDGDPRATGRRIWTCSRRIDHGDRLVVFDGLGVKPLGRFVVAQHPERHTRSHQYRAEAAIIYLGA